MPTGLLFAPPVDRWPSVPISARDSLGIRQCPRPWSAGDKFRSQPSNSSPTAWKKRLTLREDRATPWQLRRLWRGQGLVLAHVSLDLGVLLEEGVGLLEEGLDLR